MTEPTTKRTAEDVLRDLAMYLGVGGYNDIGDAPFDPEKFDRKIRWGIDYFVKATVTRCADKVEEMSKRPSTRWGEVKAAIQAIAPEPASSPAGGRVDAGRITLFSALEAAYIRGAAWCAEMGMTHTFSELRKAAYDYADKEEKDVICREVSASLSPAATPVSEAGGEAAERSWRRTKFEFIGAMRQALINSGLTREQVIIADNAITEAFSDLANPASSPAGGGEP